jgi:hypothetical protein
VNCFNVLDLLNNRVRPFSCRPLNPLAASAGVGVGVGNATACNYPSPSLLAVAVAVGSGRSDDGTLCYQSAAVFGMRIIPGDLDILAYRLAYRIRMSSHLPVRVSFAAGAI